MQRYQIQIKIDYGATVCQMEHIVSVIEKVKKVLSKKKQEIVEVEQFEEEMLGAEARLDSLHLYHLNAADPQKDPQE